jgi:hypothetical protein
MTEKCIAYLQDGRICGKSAIVIDYQRGGMVCNEHAIELLSTWIRDLQRRIRELERAIQNLKNCTSYNKNEFSSEHTPAQEQAEIQKYHRQ